MSNAYIKSHTSGENGTNNSEMTDICEGVNIEFCGWDISLNQTKAYYNKNLKFRMVEEDKNDIKDNCFVKIRK